MWVILPVASILLAILLARMAFSDRVFRYPSPRLGRLTVLALAGINLVTALSAIAERAGDGGLGSDWESKILYATAGMVASLFCVSAGLYALALAPGAYARQHLHSPSKTGEAITEFGGKAAGLFLILLGVLSVGVTLYVLVSG